MELSTLSILITTVSCIMHRFHIHAKGPEFMFEQEVVMCLIKNQTMDVLWEMDVRLHTLTLHQQYKGVGCRLHRLTALI